MKTQPPPSLPSEEVLTQRFAVENLNNLLLVDFIKSIREEIIKQCDLVGGSEMVVKKIDDYLNYMGYDKCK